MPSAVSQYYTIIIGLGLFLISVFNPRDLYFIGGICIKYKLNFIGLIIIIIIIVVIVGVTIFFISVEY